MRNRLLSGVAIVLLPWLALSGSATAGPGYIPPQYYPAQYSAPPETRLPSVPAGSEYAPLPAPARQAPTEPKDEKRGNTPPGTDRTGGGPASGAIVDPSGVVTKEPVLRER
jgi:hypothetical protein